MDHENRDVRAWAGAQLTPIDPDWSCAAISGLRLNIPTHEIMALCERVERGPPAGPSLRDMTIDELVARFEDAGIRKYATQFMGDDEDPYAITLRNATVDEMIDVANELIGRNAEAALFRLFEHRNVGVRGGAASILLERVPDRAVAVLEEVAAAGDDSMESLGASMRLWSWQRKKDAEPE